MTTRWFAALAASTLLTWGCQEPPATTPESVPAAKAPDKPAAAAKPAAKAPAKPAAAKAPVAAKPAPKKATPNPKASKLVRWDAPIDWMDWDAGLAKAKTDKKPVLVMVYGDW